MRAPGDMIKRLSTAGDDERRWCGCVTRWSLGESLKIVEVSVDVGLKCAAWHVSLPCTQHVCHANSPGSPLNGLIPGVHDIMEVEWISCT